MKTYELLGGIGGLKETTGRSLRLSQKPRKMMVETAINVVTNAQFLGLYGF
jgi:hypothetical protein